MRAPRTLMALGLALAAGTAPALLHAEAPDTLRIAGILSAGKEAPWETSFVASMERVIAARPHDLEIEVSYTENVWDNAEQVYRAYAETGEYDILFGDAAYADAVENLKDEFPDLLFVMAGSGNRGMGGNAYWIFIHAHEPAYIMGEIAGSLTQTGTVGAVSTFPAEDTNDQINAFFAGARAVNPEVKRKISYIQSWFDPAKSNEATSAQIAAGADMIYQMSGAFEVCEERGIGCFGNYVDVAPAAPNSIVASAIVRWDPQIDWIIDEWWQAKSTDAPFDAPLDPVWFGMAEGSGEVVLNPVWEEKLPPEVSQMIADSTAAILSGELEVELDMGEVQAD